jgi:hypothetical protein
LGAFAFTSLGCCASEPLSLSDMVERVWVLVGWRKYGAKPFSVPEMAGAPVVSQLVLPVMVFHATITSTGLVSL